MRNSKGTPKENEGFPGSVVLEHSNNPQRIDLEWASVWRATCKEFHKEGEGFRGSVVLEHSINSQKIDLERASVWRAN